MDYIVYEHISPTGKRYIGATKYKPEMRWRKGKGYVNKRFVADIEKYGWDNFEHNIVANGLSLEQANSLEKELIQKYNTMDKRYGYNVASGGIYNPVLSSEIRGKQSKAMREHWKEVGGFSDEHRAKLSKSHKGHPSAKKGTHCSQETKDKIGRANKGKERTPEMIQKMRDASPNKKQVICLDTGEIFVSVAEAARTYNVNMSSLANCCRGGRATAGKKRWKYV